MPSRRTFVIQSYNPFREGFKCAECRPPSEVEGNHLTYRLRFALNEVFWNFNNQFPLVSERVFDFRGKLQLEVEKWSLMLYTPSSKVGLGLCHLPATSI